MRKKIRGILLAAVFGMLTLGATAFAEEAAKSYCRHENYTTWVTDECYEPCNSEYHTKYTEEQHVCNDCKEVFETVYNTILETHSFTVYTNDGRYCSECGCEDEFFN